MPRRLHCFFGVALVFISLFDSKVAYPQEPPQGILEDWLSRAEGAVRRVWRDAWRVAENRAQEVLSGVARQQHNVLHNASVQLEKLGLDVDLNSATDNVQDDLVGCAKATQSKYTALVGNLRRQVLRCWGWEEGDLHNVISGMLAVLQNGDRLPATLQETMKSCLSSEKGNQYHRPEEGPSPFRVFRCTAESVSKAMQYAVTAPREVVRLTRRAAGLVAVTRDDFGSCAKRTVSEAALPLRQLAKDLGGCVAGSVKQQLKKQKEAVWG